MRHLHRSLLLATLALAPIPGVARAQIDLYVPPAGFTTRDTVLRRIWAIGMDSSRAADLAQVLLDSVGPRLTASPGFEAAQDWLIRTYAGWGVTARRERYGTWRAWRRGITHLDMLSPRVRSLEARMLAWSVGTPGGRPVRARVVLLPEVADSAAFAAWLPSARGAFVLASFPPPTCRPRDSWQKWELPALADSFQAQVRASQAAWNANIRRTGFAFRYGEHSLLRRLAQAGVAGILTNDWTGGWGADRVFDAGIDGVPVVDVACEDYSLLARLAEHRQGPTVELAAEAQLGGEVPVANLMAEVTGAERPHEYVVLSAHLDSWDGASGALDNGTGTIVMLEAMRILSLAYPHPKRTILAGHWGGEELGLEGSRAFVADHPGMVDSLQAVFNQDNGTGRVTGMDAAGYIGSAGRLAEYLSQVRGELTREIRFSFPGPAGPPADASAFSACGAPGFDLGSGDWDYLQYTWHSNLDTYDKISFADVRRNATLVAMLAYLASEDPTFMPRDRRSVFPTPADNPRASWVNPPCQGPDRQTRVEPAR